MRSYESKAKTREEAIALGLEALGVSLADVTVEDIDEGRKGVLGFGSRPVIVRLSVKEDNDESVIEKLFTQSEKKETKSEEPKASQPAPQKKKKAEPKAEKKSDPVPEKSAEKANASETSETKEEKSQPQQAAPVVSNGELEAKAFDFVSQITKLMGVEVTVEVLHDEEGNIRVNMMGDTLGILIGRRGETLDSLQYLTSLYVNHDQENYTRVTLDTENYRAKREDSLIRLANRMASRAVKTGRKVVMEPMNPYERRILHSALQANEYVTTHSEGEEPNRHVVITLK